MSGDLRVVINWTGFNGGPGFTNLFWRTNNDTEAEQTHANDVVAKVDAWITAISNHLPSTVTVKVDPTVAMINATDGKQIAFFSVTPPAAHPGGDSGPYSAVSGACFNWYTQGVRNGRRIRGRTFIVPLGGSKYDSVGTLASTTVTAFQNATNTMLALNGTTEMTVWSRPSGVGATDGDTWPISAFTLPDKAAFLSSRRD